MRRALAATVGLLPLLGACGGDADPPGEPANREPVVVFAAYEDRAYLPALLRDFTAETGFPVTVRHGEADRLLADVMENRITPPADVLWVRDATRLHRAAEEGALRPLPAGTVPEQVPPGLRDPDDFWTALSFDVAIIASRPDAVGPGEIADYAGLASSAAPAALCLPASSTPGARAVLATLIGDLGVRRTEAVVRQWVARLVRPVYADEARLVAALDRGDCGIAFVGAGQLAGRSAELALAVPAIPAVVAEGVGIARHARNPDAAARLVGWLSRPGVQARHAAAIGAYPASTAADVPPALVAAGARAGRVASLSRIAFEAEAAGLLAERTGYLE